jgi:predicted XRE-type DNA-binding protein
MMHQEPTAPHLIMINKDQVRLALATAVLNAGSRMTSGLLSVRIGLDPPKVAALRNGRLEIFSIERLMHLATRLGHDVELVVRPHPRENHRPARYGNISVRDQSDPAEISII